MGWAFAIPEAHRVALLPDPVDYTSKDFDALRARLIALVKSVFPDWTDFLVAVDQNDRATVRFSMFVLSTFEWGGIRSSQGDPFTDRHGVLLERTSQAAPNRATARTERLDAAGVLETVQQPQPPLISGGVPLLAFPPDERPGESPSRACPEAARSRAETFVSATLGDELVADKPENTTYLPAVLPRESTAMTRPAESNAGVPESPNSA